MYRLLLTTLLASFLALAAACETDDDGDDAEVAEEPTPIEEPDPTPTPEPEPTPVPEDDDSVAIEEDDEEEAIDDFDIPLDDDEIIPDDDMFHGDDPFDMGPDDFMEDFHDPDLAALLVTVDQLEGNWQVIAEGSPAAGADVSESLGDVMGAPCNHDPLSPDDLGDPVQVGRAFSGTEFGPIFGQDILQFDDSGQASETYDLVTEQFDCESWTEQDPATGMEIEMTVNELDFPDLGDETFAISLGLDMDMDVQAGVQQVQMVDPFEDMSAELILVQYDDLLINFSHIDVMGMDMMDLEGTITMAFEQIEAEY